MAKNQEGDCKKRGRNTDKCKKYRINQTREKNKMRRILQSEGKMALEAYADKHEMWKYFRKLVG